VMVRKLTFSPLSSIYSIMKINIWWFIGLEEVVIWNFSSISTRTSQEWIKNIVDIWDSFGKVFV
jgi:hypothetical protein